MKLEIISESRILTLFENWSHTKLQILTAATSSLSICLIIWIQCKLASKRRQNMLILVKAGHALFYLIPILHNEFVFIAFANLESWWRCQAHVRWAKVQNQCLCTLKDMRHFSSRPPTGVAKFWSPLLNNGYIHLKIASWSIVEGRDFATLPTHNEEFPCSQMHWIMTAQELCI